ncbi:MAG: nitrous oxide reductase accessory protein NosL [Pyrobaculum sp.]
MRPAEWLVLAVVAVIVGVGAYLAGSSQAKVETKTVIVTQTAAGTTTTVVRTVTVTATAGPTELEKLILNGTLAQRCVFCGMDVSEAEKMGVSAVVRFSTGVVAETDDIGCVFRMALLPVEKWRFLSGLIAKNVTTAAELKKRLGDVVEVLVPDYASFKRGAVAYVDAKKAYYIIMQNMKTPMGDCVFAFANKDEAAMHNSTVYTYDQMLQLYRDVMQKTGMPRPNWCRGGGGMHSH